MLRLSEWNVSVCENWSYSLEREQALIDAAQASETRHREDFLGYFINKLYLCSLHFSTYLLNR